MDTSLAIIVIAIILILLYVRARTEKEISETQLNTEIENDTLVLIHGNYETIKKVVIDFCKIYNDKSLEIRLRLIEYADHKSFVVFPYDITFEKLCFLHNYLMYPNNLKVDFEVISWINRRKTIDFNAGQLLFEKCMLYLSEIDSEYDNVYIVTENNRNFKIDFADGISEINHLEKAYVSPTIDIEILRKMPYEDFQ
jgi:hypothetical protein